MKILDGYELLDLKQLRQEIKNNIHEENYEQKIINLLKMYKNKGLTQNNAIEILESIRAELEQNSEDKVLVILDFVTGFCSKKYKVW